MKPDLGPSDVRRLFDCDPERGCLIWRERTTNRIRVGDVAGGVDLHGYIVVGYRGRQYKAHRLIWLHHYGRWPDGHIDHINGDAADNRIVNLRECSDAENMQNWARGKRNKSGYLGVSWDQTRGKWQASIQVDGKSIGLGRFDNAQAASAAYLDAKNRHHKFQPTPRAAA